MSSQPLPTRPSAEITRARILDAAERCIADRGVAAVSLREIARAAGQKNVAAVQYHFGSKEELIRAIFHDRMGEYDKRRVRYLNELPKDASLRDIVDALVRPIAERLELGEAGYVHLVFSFQVQAYSGELHELTSVESYGEGFNLGRGMIATLQPHVSTGVLQRRFRMWGDFVVFSFADRARRLRTGEVEVKNNARFVRELTDASTGLFERFS